MKKIFVLSSAVALLAVPALAIDLQAARAQGAVCENSSGYIQKVSGGADVDALVVQVNAGRKAEYEKISAANGQPVDVVGKIAAGKISGKKC